MEVTGSSPVSSTHNPLQASALQGFFRVCGADIPGLPKAQRWRALCVPDREAGVLTKDAVHHGAVHIGQTEVSTGVTICQSFVVKPECVEQCRVQIVHVHGFSAGAHPNSSVEPYVKPPLTPPPAIHMVNAVG